MGAAVGVPGGFELDAAEGICADDRLTAEDVLELLAALADKSVLIAEHGGGMVRYRLSETLREFGQECLQRAGEDTALRRRHRDWYEQLARQADTGWPSRQTADLTARLFREHANVRAAQDFCQAEPGEAEAGLRIALYVWRFFYWDAGHISEGRYWLGQALARAAEPTVWRAQGLLVPSFLPAWSGDRDASRALLAEGTSLALAADRPACAADATGTAGGPPGGPEPQRQGDRRRTGDLAADRRRTHEAHPHQARLHLTRPGRRLGRLPTGRRRLRAARASRPDYPDSARSR